MMTIETEIAGVIERDPRDRENDNERNQQAAEPAMAAAKPGAGTSPAVSLRS